MNFNSLIDTDQLRVGMYIHLDVGWLRHPFPVNKFRISTPEQIETIRKLGVSQVRWSPENSLKEVGVAAQPAIAEGAPEGAVDDVASNADTDGTERQTAPGPSLPRGAGGRLDATANISSLEKCNQRFAAITHEYKLLENVVTHDAVLARSVVDHLIAGSIEELDPCGGAILRLLSEGVGERTAQHPVNVMVLSLLLGRSMALQPNQLRDLGAAALIHDLGELKLSASAASVASPAELAKKHESHVGESVALAVQMGMSAEVFTAVAQHHEMADGTGFPLCLMGADMSRNAQILALVNRFDRMCNPVQAAEVLTPHEALSALFAQFKSCFDGEVMLGFIRMMGVYPPGSVVQLSNNQYGIVTSVNVSQPLRPQVLVHDPMVVSEEKRTLDLSLLKDLGIRRSLKPAQLPREAIESLMPRQRICYFFERAVMLDSSKAKS